MGELSGLPISSGFWWRAWRDEDGLLPWVIGEAHNGVHPLSLIKPSLGFTRRSILLSPMTET